VPSLSRELKYFIGYDVASSYRFLLQVENLTMMVVLPAGMGLISGAVGSLLSLMIAYEHDVARALAGADAIPALTASQSFVKSTKDAMSELTNSFKFFPIFMLIGFLAYAVERWARMLATAMAIKDALSSAGLIIGGNLQLTHEKHTWQLAFDLYRYLNVAHFFTYSRISPWFDMTTDSDLIDLGLLTPVERDWLMKDGSRDTVMERETALAWALAAIGRGCRENRLLEGSHSDIIGAITEARKEMDAFHNIISTQQPNVWVMLMAVVINVLLVLYVIGSPFTMYSEEGIASGCVQIWTVVGVFFLSFPMTFSKAIIGWLDSPLTGNIDILNVDSMLAATEQCLFAELRAQFDRDAQHATKLQRAVRAWARAKLATRLMSRSISSRQATLAAPDGPEHLKA